ncbi:MAG TPA: trigger factor [Ilumatobacteraceae bacterium]|nr:trigger factor [Thermoleophilia bacterium]HUV16895.1 trigger factor [Ilumatobacteraceae bacterium]
MKTKVSPTGENEVELSVEVPVAAVKKVYDRTVAKVREEMQLPGFRKGRVPVDLVIQNVGADFIRGEALEDAIPEWGDEALHEAGLYDAAVGTSDLQVGPLDETADYSFSLKVQTLPVPTLGEYKGLEVPKREVDVTDDQISAQLAMLQERLSSLQPIEDRPVQDGDFVLMDMSGARDGEPIEGAQGKDQMYEVGRASLIPGFEEELIGVNAGDEKSFDITFPDDYHAEELAGQLATFTVTVKEIKEKVVPELDDAFAADVSEFETMEELSADVRERLQAAAEAGVEREFRAAAVEKAVEHATIAVPVTMVDREAHRLFHQLEERVGEQGLTMDVYLGVLEKTPQDIEEEMRPQAEFIIKRQLVLEAIAEAEKLEVTDDDIAEVVKRDAEALGRDHLQLLADLEKSGRREALRDEMLVAKAADLVADAAVAVPMTEAEEAAAEESADAVDPDAD